MVGWRRFDSIMNHDASGDKDLSVKYTFCSHLRKRKTKVHSHSLVSMVESFEDVLIGLMGLIMLIKQSCKQREECVSVLPCQHGRCSNNTHCYKPVCSRPCRTARVTKELKSFSFIKDTPEMDGEAITCHTTEEEMFFYSQRAVRA